MGSVGSFISNPIGAATSWAGGQLLGDKAGKSIGRVMNPLGNTIGRMIDGPQDVGTGMGMGGGGQSGYGGQMYDEQGRPILEDRASQNNPDGTIKSQYQTTDATNMGAMNQARQEAMRPAGEMSKWGQMALSQGQNQNAMQAAGKQSQAMNNLAMQGGLRGGARERLATAGMQGQLQANQNTYSQIQNQDESSRQSNLQNQVSNEAQYGQAANNIQNTNIGRGIAENQAGDAFNMDRYGQAMTAWGADKSSAAAANQARAAKSTSGLFGGGGFLGTGLGSK